jgi:hypothetical protein
MIEVRDYLKRFKQIEDSKVQQCLVCMDAPSNMIISPCMHLCLCAVCANGTNFDKCPKCRGRIECVKKVYF